MNIFNIPFKSPLFYGIYVASCFSLKVLPIFSFKLHFFLVVEVGEVGNCYWLGNGVTPCSAQCTNSITQLKKSWECNCSIEGVTLLYQHNSDFTL